MQPVACAVSRKWIQELLWTAGNPSRREEFAEGHSAPVEFEDISITSKILPIGKPVTVHGPIVPEPLFAPVSRNDDSKSLFQRAPAKLPGRSRSYRYFLRFFLNTI